MLDEAMTDASEPGDDGAEEKTDAQILAELLAGATSSLTGTTGDETEETVTATGTTGLTGSERVGGEDTTASDDRSAHKQRSRKTLNCQTRR